MFTQCAKCETVFKLSAETLRAASGQVRCGRCGEVFNALARLAEDASAFSTGESPLEMEARADRILHTAALPGVTESAASESQEDLAAADHEFAQLQIVDDDLQLYDDAHLEPPRRPRVPPRTPPPPPGSPQPRIPPPPGAPPPSPDPAGAVPRAAPAAPATPRSPATPAPAEATASPAPPSARGPSSPGPRAPPLPTTQGAPPERAAFDALGASTPGASSPGASSPGASTPGASTPRASSPGASTPGASTPGASTPGASTPGASRPRTPALPPDEASADAAADDTAMEFTLPPGELDRIFVEHKPRQAVATPTAYAAPGAGEASATTANGGAPAVAAPESAASVIASGRSLGHEVPDQVRDEMLAGIEELPLPEVTLVQRRSAPLSRWLGIAIVLGIVLMLQIVYQNRPWFAAHAPLGGTLRALYSAVGLALPVPANLSAYQLRQWGAAGDPGASGTLRVRASILNTAAQLQPYPLLRVTLANRFGTKIGTRDFSPAEYLGKPTARLLGPGERVDATLDIVDPGKDAEGFELDVCVRGADEKVTCAADAATQAKQ